LWYNGVDHLYAVRGTHASGIFCELPKHTPRGVPNIIAVRDGRAIFLEVKTETGKLSEDQEEFRRRELEVGAQYEVVRSIDDVQALRL
jgi:hypothetical protein